jgi:hypothetical protein
MQLKAIMQIIKRRPHAGIEQLRVLLHCSTYDCNQNEYKKPAGKNQREQLSYIYIYIYIYSKRNV